MLQGTTDILKPTRYCGSRLFDVIALFMLHRMVCGGTGGSCRGFVRRVPVQAERYVDQLAVYLQTIAICIFTINGCLRYDVGVHKSRNSRETLPIDDCGLAIEMRYGLGYNLH